MSSNILKKELKEGIIRNIYLIYGEEEYLKKLYSKKIESAVLGNGNVDINKFVFYQPKDVSKIKDLCETLPCFSDKKFILIKNSGYFKSTKKEKKSLKDSLCKLVNTIPEYVCIVFLEEDIDKRLKLIKVVEERGLVVEFGVQSQGVLLKWVVSEMKKRGKDVHTDVAFKIIQYCNFFMNAISNEMDKLEFYVGDRKEITFYDVEAVCTKDISVRIFDLIDNITFGRADIALKNLKDMLILREPIQKIMFMLIKHFTQLLDIKMLLMEGLTVKDCVSIMKISPYAASKMAQQVSSFEINFLREILKKILDLDYKIKIGNINDILAVQIIIMELCGV